MSIRKKIAAVLAAIMTATTLSIPAYAADTEAVMDFVEFIKDNVTVSEDNKVVTLTNDITLDSLGIGIQKQYLNEDGAVTIDLAQHTVTVTSDINALVNFDADVTLKNGTIVMAMADGVVNKDAYAVRNKSGNLAIENLVVQGDRGALYNEIGKIVVNSGTFSAKQYQAVYNSGGDVILNNGTFNAGIYSVSGYNEINGGTYNAVLQNEKKGNVNVSGVDRYADMVINGGSFKHNPTGANITFKDGYKAAIQEDGRYALVEKGPEPEIIAKIQSGKELKFVEEIAEALRTPYTNVELMTDITLAGDLLINDASGLKLCGHVVSGEGYTITVNGGNIENYDTKITGVVGLVQPKVILKSGSVGGCVVLREAEISQDATSVSFSAENYLYSPIIDKLTGDYSKITLIGARTKFLKNYFGELSDESTLISQIKTIAKKDVIDTQDGYYTAEVVMAKTSTENYYYLDDAINSTISAEQPIKVTLNNYIPGNTKITIPENANIELVAKSYLKGSSSLPITIINGGSLKITSNIGTNASNRVILDNNDICVISGGTIIATLQGTGTYNISGGTFSKATLSADAQYVISGGTFATGVLTEHPEWIAEGYEVNSAGTGVQKKVALPTMTTSAATIFTGVNDTKAAAFTTTVQGAEGYTISKFHWNVTSNNVKKFSKEALTDGKTIEGAGEFIFGLIIDGLDDTGAVAKGVINDSIIEQ